MVEEKQEIQAILKSTHLFNRLGSDAIENVADQFKTTQIAKGEDVFQQGDDANSFYIILEGKVQVTQKRGNQTVVLATLIQGDYFGEEALITHRARSATVTAMEKTSLLYLDQEHFYLLLQTSPQFKMNLQMAVATRQLARKTSLPWLQPDEVVYYISRRNILFMYVREIGPMLLFFAVLIAFIALYFNTSGGMVLPYLAAGVAAAAAVLWGVWNYIDWSNDYFIVTNRRVINLERIIGIYDSRQEAPLTTILSVGVSTTQASRVFGYGDVNIRTYTGLVVFDRVGYPEQVAALVEEQWFRAKATSRKEEAQAMNRAIRERLGLPIPGQDSGQAARPAAQVKATYQPGFLQEWFSHVYTMRFEEGSTITYRRHWFNLIQTTWKPALLILLGIAIIVLRLIGVFDFFSIPTVLILCGIWILVFLGWYLYNYIDWRNDIFQITSEQILDIDRKPFGKEEKKAAPLDNILSVQYERLGITGLLFNFGTVYITVGGTKFTFDEVYNPSEVQQDIFRRMAERNARKKKQELQAERERVTDWFAAYHEVTQEEELRRRMEQEEQDDLDFDLGYKG